MAPMTIEGTVQKISWRPDKFVKGLRGMSGSAGIDRTIPAHYWVALTDTKVTSGEGGPTPFRSGDTIRIKLNHAKDDGFLKQGARIRIIGFRMRGDEGGVHTSFKKIEILDGQGTGKPGKQDAVDGK